MCNTDKGIQIKLRVIEIYNCITITGSLNVRPVIQ